LALEAGIEPKNFMFDIRIAGYLLNSVSNLYTIPDLMNQYLEKVVEIPEEKQVQMNLFEIASPEEKVDERASIYAYSIGNLQEVLKKELEKNSIIIYHPLQW